MTTYRTFIRSCRNWAQFAHNRKRTVDRRLSYDEARRAADAYNRDRSAAQRRNGTMMEFESE